MKRLNESRESFSLGHQQNYHVNPTDKKKLKDDNLLSKEVNMSRWEVLMLNPSKNAKLIDSEFKSMEKNNVILLLKYKLENIRSVF